MNTKEKDEYVGMNAGDQAAMRAAADIIARGQQIGDQSLVDEGNRVTNKIKESYNLNEADNGQSAPAAGPKKTVNQSSPSYINQYQNTIDRMRNGILNRKAFTYDHNNDPMYQQYEDSYTRMGQQAMEDTLAQVSARTGGLASSYAGAAAQQTYNGYMAALADKVPELRQLAYQMYMDEGDTMRANLQMLQGLEATEYGRHRDQVADNQWQQEFDTQNSQWQQKFDYEKEQDADSKALAAAQLMGEAGDFSGYQGVYDLSEEQVGKLQESYGKGDKLAAAQLLAQAGDYSGYQSLLGLTDEQVATLSANHDSSKLLAAAELMAQAGDFSGYKSALNLTDEQVTTLEAWYQKQNAPKVTGGGGGGNKYTKAQAEAAVASALAGHTEDPYVRSIIEGYFGMPMEAYLAGRAPEKGVGYDDAVNYVKTNFAYDPDAAWDYLDRQYKKEAISGDEALYIFDTILGFNSDDYKPKVSSIGIIGTDWYK